VPERNDAESALEVDLPGRKLDETQFEVQNAYLQEEEAKPG
jgi:hypothetical protein